VVPNSEVLRKDRTESGKNEIHPMVSIWCQIFDIWYWYVINSEELEASKMFQRFIGRRRGEPHSAQIREEFDLQLC